MKVPFFIPDVGDAENQALRDVIDSRWITMGPRVEEFERRFAELIGTRHAVALSSGTAALHLAALCLDLGPGDEVILPSLTFVATANAIRYTGATPVFADVRGMEDWTLCPEQVEAAIGPKTRAVVAMHYAGYPCDQDRLQAVCDARGLRLIEDACHGLGGSLDGRPMGALSEMGCFSFYSNKVMTTAEGGMLTTDDEQTAARARRLRSHGMSNTAIDRMRGSLHYTVTELGYNYRLDDLRAALGLVQLDKLSESLRRRRELVDHYRGRLESMPGVTAPLHGSRGAPAHYVFPVCVDEGIDRDAVRARLEDAGIQTSMHFPPVHRLEPYQKGAPELAQTERIAARAMSLPLYPALRFEQIDRVCDELAATL
jgi:dTDP-4-amino-4,6-dideoxygalactose transaminase